MLTLLVLRPSAHGPSGGKLTANRLFEKKIYHLKWLKCALQILSTFIYFTAAATVAPYYDATLNLLMTYVTRKQRLFCEAFKSYAIVLYTNNIKYLCSSVSITEKKVNNGWYAEVLVG